MDSRHLIPRHAVEEARNAFESRPANTSKVKAGFDDLITLFSDPQQTLESIANTFGVTRQAVHQLYNRYFRQVLGEREKERGFQERQRARRVRRAESHEPMSRFVTEIKKRGFSVSEIPKSLLPADVVKKRLIVNGHRCALSFLDTPRNDPRRLTRYFKLGISQQTLREVDFVLVLTISGDTHRFFVMPSHALTATYGTTRPIGVYLAESKTFDPRGPALKFNYWDYEDFWGLLKS